MNIDISTILGRGRLDLVSSLSSGIPSASPVKWGVSFRDGYSMFQSYARASAGATSSELTALGDRTFSIKDQYVPLDDTGVTVKVSDFSLEDNYTEKVVGEKKYIVPSYTKMGEATIDASSGSDKIYVHQDEVGNTVLDVTRDGRKSSLNLGKIASLTINGNGGDDDIKVDVGNYYGGINIVGGSGEDTINVASSYSMGKGVTISGGAGADKLTISGMALALYVSGGEGDDEIHSEDVAGEPDFARDIYGDAGNDLIYGSAGIDSLYGGEGHDLLVGMAGNDIIFGNTGNDRIYGNAGADTIHGNEGDDTVNGGFGADSIYGNAGDDVLMGGGSGDIIRGDEGADRLYGGDGDKETIVRSKSGRLSDIAGYNSLYGGAGADTFLPSSLSPAKIVAYSGTGNYLMDYDPVVDVLV